MPFSCYLVDESSRKDILNLFPPRWDLIGHNITLQYPVMEKTVPEPACIEIVGYACDDDLECLVASVNGTVIRPDGKTFHLTWSLNRAAGRKPHESNYVLQRGWEPIQPFPISVIPAWVRG